MFKYTKKEFFKGLQEANRPKGVKVRNGTLDRLLGRVRERAPLREKRGVR